MTCRRVPFDEVITDVSGGNAKTPSGQILPRGKFPVVDQGKQLISGYVNDSSRLCKVMPPVIVFGDHTRCLKYVDFPFCIGADGVKVLRPRIQADSKYLYYFLRGVPLPDAGYSRHFKFLKRCEIPLPPVSEQRRIAEVLDRAEALRAKRRAALAKLDTFLSSLFWHSFRIKIGSPAVHASRKLIETPQGWRWAKLTDVARLATGHTPDRKRHDFWNGETPWLSLSDIRVLDGGVAYGTREAVTELGIANSSAVKLPVGTVCFSRTASVGFVTIMGREMCTSQDFVNWVCGPDLDPIFLLRALFDSRRSLVALSTGSTHRTIYFPTVEEFRVIIPPLALQREFAEQVKGTERLRASFLASQAKLDALFASLQHRAFRGEL